MDLHADVAVCHATVDFDDLEVALGIFRHCENISGSDESTKIEVIDLLASKIAFVW